MSDELTAERIVIAGNKRQAMPWVYQGCRYASSHESVMGLRRGGEYFVVGTWASRDDNFEILQELELRGFKEVNPPKVVNPWMS